MIDNGAENDGGRARNDDVKKDHISIHKLAGGFYRSSSEVA